MLRQLISLFILFAFFVGNAQTPSNDTPCNATSLGTLPTPGACTSGLQNGAPVTLNNQSTVGATGASPYVYQTQCTGGGNQTSPALDTWYSFVASGYIVNVTISGFPNASIALWTGTCNNLSSALGCTNVPSGGTGTLTFNQMVVGQTYWIEVSGGTSTATDASFSISVDNDIDCNDCLTQGSLTASPLPVNGGYTAGQVVNFCYTVTGWTQINTNWFHGVQISMASGWTGTITNTVPATTLQNIPGPGSDGDWLFYPTGIGTVNGTNWGPGFYFDTPDAGTIASDNFGDNCNGSTCTWTFCWSLTVGPCTPGMSLNVTVNTSGDGETGSWSNAGCVDDNATTFAAIGVCCTPPLVSLSSQTICSGSNATLTPTVSPTGGTYTWSNSATSSSITVTPATTTTYSVTYSSGGCSNTASATVTVNAQTIPTFTQVAAICSGGTFTLPTTSNNGITGTWAPAINNTATTTYTFTPTAGQCATTTTMTVTVNTPVTPTFTQVPAICSGGTFTLPNTSNNGITGTWSPAINNTATTTYTFTPTAGQCATTTTMTVTVNAQTVPTFTQVTAICSGGTFTLPTTSNNGIAGTWAPAINNTATTTYTFTPTAGQCATTTTMTVTVNAQTLPTFTQVAPICSGGTFTLPTTSNNGITGTWAPAINNTATTTYTFTPTAGQCGTTTTMTVTVNAQTVPTFNQVAPICSGGTFTLPITSNEGITGTWSPAINNTTTTTYTFTPTAGQCATTTTMTVNVGAPVTPTFTQVAAICSGGTFTLPTTSTDGYTGTWAPAIDNTTTTTYTFTPTAGQCATTTTMTVTVNPLISPTFTQVAAICSGGTFTLPTTSDNSITGTWAPAINNTATTTYTFTPTAGQCATTTTMTVIVDAQTVPTFTQVAAICSGGTFTLPTTSDNGINGTWTPTINNTATTTYTFTPTTGQCATTTTMTVSVNAPTVPTFSQVAAICSGETFTLPTTSNNGIIGTWAPAINNTSTTTYTFTPDAGQCATTTTMSVTVNAPVTPTFNQIAQICSGGSFTLPTTSTNGYTGTWSPTIDNTTTTTYTFTPTAGQCATTTTMTVSVGPPATPTFTQVAPICSGGNITLPTTSNDAFTGTWSPAINNTATTTYTFTPSSGQCATTTTMSVTVNTPTTPTFTQIAAICSGGSFTLPTTSTNGVTGTWSPAINNTATTTYTFTPSVGQCATTTTMTVNVNAPTVPTFTQIAAICSGGTITLPTTSNNGITGAWSPSVNNTTTTTYTFTPSVGQCATTANMTVTVNAPTIPTFTQIAAICAGGTITLPTTSNNGVTGTWAPAINNAATTTYTFTPTAGLCATATTMTITVNPPTTPTFTQVAAICSGGSFSLPTTSNNGITGSWSPVINNTSTTTYTFTPNAGQCATTTTMTVTVNTIPNLSFTADTLGGCAPLQVNFTNLSNAGNCQWTLGNGVTLSGCNSNYLFTDAGCYDVTLTASLNGCTSSVTYQDYICVEEPPIANFSTNPTIFSEPYQNINFINSSIGAATYLWEFGDNATSTDENPNHFYTNTESGYMITLTAYSQFGCSDQVQVPIDYTEVEIFYVPNTFTPDGDNFNQTFHAVFTSGFDPYNFQMLIFDRWGEVIWESHNANVGWDGTYGYTGRKVPDGVYTWKINFKRQKTDDKRVVVGHVTLIR